MLSAVSVAAAETEPRIALVIGNGDYAAGRLANAVLDARSMADSLRDLGFKVLAHENTGYREMRRQAPTWRTPPG